MRKTTIGQDDATPFETRGTGKRLEDWDKAPLASQGGQKYGYGVTPQNMVTPRGPGQWKAGANPKHLNVARPSGRKDKVESLEGMTFGVPVLRKR